MQKFSVTILGSNSALPANGRNPTSQLLNVNNQYYLIDCGEGTQMQLRRYRLKMQRISAIFISHLHGDHYFGLLGLLNSLHLLGRTAPITIICPSMLKQIIDIQMNAAGGKLQYPIEYKFTDDVQKRNNKRPIYLDKHIEVEAFPLKHRIDCCGFTFKEVKGEYKYLPEKGSEIGIKIQEIPQVKKGKNVVREDGTQIFFKDVTHPPDLQRTYAYCTDTRPLESTSEYARHADVMYHEATFLFIEASRAKQTYHSTALKAGEVAKNAKVGQLLIGHFSARYDNLIPLLDEAKQEFENTDLAIEGKEFEINLKDTSY
jgi:ribonuclease Z